MAMRNVDSLLHDDTQTRLQAMNADSTQSMPEPVERSEPEEIDHKVEETDSKVEAKVEEKEDLKPEIAEIPQESEKKSLENENNNLDPYGNELPQERTYTRSEVNEMIRDRLSRGRHAQDQQSYTPQQQQIAHQATQDFQPDPNSADDWETQLSNFIDHRIDQRENTARSKAAEEREARIQAEFEHKFTTGMSRYDDFSQVTRDKPITDAMMYAARAMDDPSAFIYAASKNHAKELERIAQIQDPYAQATEIGKLEATMRKVKATPAAQKPLAPTKGDYAAGKKQEVKRSIDQLIHSDAKRRFRR